ncbi:unnamed protein product [Durusdinium trenchii]|uniref:Uncharacterized protein n=1 Tax=Durusdinium trenchii TaxID=1381693 RepID=A0ABP0PNG4_9DINO
MRDEVPTWSTTGSDSFEEATLPSKEVEGPAKEDPPKRKTSSRGFRIRASELQRLKAEQNKIREEVESQRNSLGVLQLERRLLDMASEMEEKNSSIESVILDLAKELVTVAQEVENINGQGALVEGRLERLETSMSPFAPSFKLENEAPVTVDDWNGGARRSPSELASRPGRPLTWSCYEAPGQLVGRAQERLTRPRTLPVLGTAPVTSEVQALGEYQLRLEASVARALELQMPAAAQQLSARAEELQKHLERAVSEEAELRKKELGEEVEKAMALLTEVKKDLELHEAKKAVEATRLDSRRPEVDEAETWSPKQGKVTGVGNTSHGATGGQERDKLAQEPFSPTARVGRRRPSQRILGALACLGVVKPTEKGAEKEEQ